MDYKDKYLKYKKNI